MNRDSFKSKEYFDNYIAYENQRITKFTNLLCKLPSTETEKIRQCEYYLSTFCKEQLSAMYSAGYDKNSIKPIVVDYMKHSERSEINSYSDMLDILSLAILFDFGTDMLENTLKNFKFDDSLILLLKKIISNNTIYLKDDEINYPVQYKPFMDILNNPNLPDAEENLLYFMEHTWYSLNEDMAWFDSHKNLNNTYYGYWCWLSVIIIKIKKMNKNIFSSCKYIPLDLL